ncbi:MAG: DUF5666 domain-containing protein [Anaerolineae bacterium]
MEKHKLAIGMVLGMLVSLLLAGGLALGVAPTLAQGPTKTPTTAAGTTTQGQLKGALLQALNKHAARGKITAINGATITVETARGNATVNTDAQTRFRRNGQVISLADLKVGDDIAIVGKNSNGTITARMITVILPHEGGVVTAVNGSQISIQRNYLNGSILTNASTVFARGKDTMTLADIKVGDHILATGTANGDATFTATRVVVQMPHTGGKVTAVNGSNITIQQGSMTGVILTTHDTTFTRGGQTIKLSDITVGSVIAAQGVANSDGTLTATRIVVKGK